MDDIVSSQRGFDYFHDGVWKRGCFDQSRRVFIGTYQGHVTTVIDDVTSNYIRNLQQATP